MSKQSNMDQALNAPARTYSNFRGSNNRRNHQGQRGTRRSNYGCGQDGHIERMCPSRGPVQCSSCGGTNHPSSRCRFKDQICYKCRKVGHIARMCRPVRRMYGNERPAQEPLDVPPHKLAVPEQAAVETKEEKKSSMETIIRDGKYESVIKSGAHGWIYQKEVGLLLFLSILEFPDLRLGYEVKEAGIFDDVVLIDDKNEVIHYIQTKHGDSRDGTAKPIDRKDLFPNVKGKGAFEMYKYLNSYVKNFFELPYTKKFYILTNRAVDTNINEPVKTVEPINSNEMQPFFGSQGRTFKLTRDIIKELTDCGNKDINEIKDAIKYMFNDGKVFETLRKYYIPLREVLEIDKDYHCSFSQNFISEGKKSGNNSLHNLLKKDLRMDEPVKVDVNFLIYTVNELRDDEINEVAEAIKYMFLYGTVSETLKKYCTPLEAVLEIDEDNHCSFLKNFISESETSGNNKLYKSLKKDGNMNRKVKVDRNFLLKDPKFRKLPILFSETNVEEFIRDFSLMEGQRDSFRSVIDSKLQKWLRTWMRPDKLGELTENDMDRAYKSLEKCFDELSKTPNVREKLLLTKDEIVKCLEELRGDFVEKPDYEDAEEQDELYINRRIAISVKTKHQTSQIIYDTQFVEEIRNRFQDQQCIVLVADPGMGKTRLLQFIAFEVQKKYDLTVYLVYFNRLVKALHGIQDMRNFKDVISVLQTVISKKNCDMIRNAPDQRTSAGFSILLVMDGFDEIHSKYSKKVINMLKLIQTKRSIQIMISSRMHTQTLLEKKFKVQSMFLKPFTEEDQINYLKKSWNVPDYAEEAFKVYSYKFLKKFQTTIRYRFFLDEICGIPLMMRMLAVIRCDNFNQYLEMVTSNHEHYFDFSSDKLDVVQLYEQFIRKCFTLKSVEKSRGTFEDADLDTMITGHIKEHQLLALKLLDIEIDEKLFKNDDNVNTYERFRHRCEKESEKSRLVKVIEDEVQFSHLSFSEYFVAKYICDNIRTLKADRILHVLSERELIRKFSMIRLEGMDQKVARLDRFCEIDLCFATWACESGCFKIVSFLIEQIKPLLVKDLSMFFSISVMAGHVEICGLLLEHGADPNKCDKTRQTALHLAARKGHVAVVKLLLSHNANVSALDKSGWTALHAAAKKGNVQIIQLLIKAGANTNSQGYENETPLHIAVKRRHGKASKLLIENNADVNMVDVRKRTALHFATVSWNDCLSSLYINAEVHATDNDGYTALLLADLSGWAELVELLLNQNANVNAVNEEGCTLFHMAVRGGNVQLVQTFINAGADINCLTYKRRTPLHYAAVNGFNHVAAKLLIRHNSDVNAVDDKKCTALHLAGQCFGWTRPKYRDYVSLVELLIQHQADVNAPDCNGLTPLHSAAAGGGSPLIIQSLIDAKALVNSRTNGGETALHHAARRGNKKAAEILIAHHCDVNAISDEGSTALHLAAQCESFCDAQHLHAAVVELLLQHHANVNAIDKYGRTALHNAAKKGNVEIILSLITAGAKINTRTNAGRTSLHEAAREGHEKASELLISHGIDLNAVDIKRSTALHLAAQSEFCRGSQNKHAAVVELLLQHHTTNVNAIDEDGRTALHNAAKEGKVQIIQSLITAGAKINTRTKAGRTALQEAAREGHEKASELLIGHGIDLNAVDRKRNTALHLAAQFNWFSPNHVPVVEVLLRHHADVNVLDENGRSPLQLAIETNRYKVAELLIAADATAAD